MDLPAAYTMLRALGPRTTLVQDAQGRPRVLKRAKSALPDDTAALLLEAHRAGRLPPLGFAPTEAVSVSGPVAHYLMPYQEGFAATAVPARLALQLARDLLAGLARLHALGYVHAGLTPQRVRLREGEPPTIVGYGRLTPIGHPAGRPAAEAETAAPEIAAGLPLDPRTDVYAVGRLLAGWLGRLDPLLERIAPLHAADPAARPPDAAAALELLGEPSTRHVPSPAHAGLAADGALPPGAMALGARLAVAGVPLGLAEAVGTPDQAPPELWGDWDRLLREGLVRPVAPGRYSLYREADVDFFTRGLGPEARRAHHKSVLRALEERPDSPLLLLVAHAKAAQDAPSVVRWALPAGREALASGRPGPAAEALEDGLAALPAQDGRAGAFWLALATARRQLGERERARQAFSRALEAKLTSRERLSALLAFGADPGPEAAAPAERERRRAHLDEALQLAESLGDAAGRFVARILRLEADAASPPAWLPEWLGERAPEGLSPAWLARGRVAAGSSLLAVGREVEGLALVQQGLAEAEALEGADRLAVLAAALPPLRRSGRAALFARTGAAVAAIARAQREPSLAVEGLLAYFEASVWVGAAEAIASSRAALASAPGERLPEQLARQRSLALRAAAALGELTQAEGRLPALPTGAAESPAWALAAAEAALASGRPDEAAAWLAALPDAEPDLEVQAARLTLSGALGEARGAFGPARRAYIQALALGSPPWERRALEGLARLARAEGHPREAAGWADQAGRALAVLFGPQPRLWSAAALAPPEPLPS